MRGSKDSDVVAQALDRRGKRFAPEAGREAAEPRPDEGWDVLTVYRAHAGQVWRWVQRLGGPGMDVEDAVQEVFLVVHRRLAGFRGEAQLQTWLYRVTANVVHRRRRKERWRQFLGGSAEDVAGGLPSTARGPEADVEGEEAARELYRALEGMKPRHREVLVLFELEGCSGEEIATLLGAKTATVWVWLHRARAELARRLEDGRAREEKRGRGP